MPWTVYILRCGDGTLYTGITIDMDRRLTQHQRGKGAKYTRGRGPITLAYREERPDKGSALRRELAIKALGREEKERLIAGEGNMENKHYAYFRHTQCEYFPCHPGADRENFNCLFCYCPLYLLGDQCGGDFRYTAEGVKDCSACLYPHRREHYGELTARIQEINGTQTRK